MQSIVFALLVAVAAASMTEMDATRKGMMKHIMTMDPKDMHSCTTDADCTAFPTMTKCGMHFKLCRPADWPELMMTEGTCTDDSMCKPMRRCMNGMCHFSGPKACMTTSDCMTGVTGMTYECMELPKTAPGMRCYPKCTTDDMCHHRMPEEFKTKIGCCGGHCQKKTAC
jgi:hypothetical protein